jgi:hypothetical protein
MFGGQKKAGTKRRLASSMLKERYDAQTTYHHDSQAVATHGFLRVAPPQNRIKMEERDTNPHWLSG